MKPATKREVWICLLLGIITIAVYWPVRHHNFIILDDPVYVIADPFVTMGVTLEGVVWAFTGTHAGNWHPLTTISLMVDAQLFGIFAGPMLFENAVWHALSSLMLFWLLRRTTGAVWRSAMVAALFAWHPLRVESVAWVSERKDVLSMFFGLVTLLAYCQYTVQPRRRWQALAIVALACSLMSKATMVTLPCVMLLLDYWPLKRFELADLAPARRHRLTEIVLEKIPFLLLVLGAAVITFLVQKEAGAIGGSANNPLVDRLGNSVISTVRYVQKSFWPVDLAIFYPLPTVINASHVLLALACIVAVTVFTFRRSRSQPFLVVGWLWFLGTLVPMIGLVRIGAQAMADRYAYLPHIGLFIAVVWGAAALVGDRRFASKFTAVFAVGVLLACLSVTARQLSFWRSTKTVFAHCLAVTRDNYVAHLNLGLGAMYEGNVDEAVWHYSEAVRVNPDLADRPTALASSLLSDGKPKEALAIVSTVFNARPDYAEAHAVAGDALASLGRMDEAISHYRLALETGTPFSTTYHHLGRALASKNRWLEAIDCYTRALKIQPDFPDASNDLATARSRIF